MKQQIIELKKKLLLIELPEGAKDIKISTLGDIIFKTNGTKEVVWLADDRVVRKCIDKLTDITESQYQKWVGYYEWEDSPNGGKYAFRDYKDGEETDDYWDMYPFDTAKESFFSYLEKEGILFSNPLADYDGRGIVGFRKQFEEAESKVWQLSQTYLFRILN